MVLNPLKCNTLTITLKKNKIDYIYLVDNKPINKVLQHRDLGVILDSSLTFSFHLDNLLKKCNMLLGLMWRNCKYLEPNFKAYLYITLIQPNLDFCSVIYNSISKTQASRIERLHFRFLRYISHNQNNIDFKFPIKSPLSRRIFNDQIFLFKCLTSTFDCELVSYFSLRAPVRILRNNDVLHVPLSRVNILKNGFISRLSSSYNNLVQANPSLDLFNSDLPTFRRSILSIIS